MADKEYTIEEEIEATNILTAIDKFYDELGAAADTMEAAYDSAMVRHDADIHKTSGEGK